MNRKLILYIVSVFIFAIGLFFIQNGLNIAFEKISFTQFAPSLGLIITVLLFKDLFLPIKIVFNRFILLKMFLAVIIPLVMCLIVYFIGIFFKLKIQIETNISSMLLKMGIGLLIGAIAEEIGWRSFLQPTLEKNHSVFISSVIVGLIWGLWHMNYYFNGILFVLTFIIFSISASIIIMYLLKETQYSIIISSLFHASINISFRIFFGINLDSKILFYLFLINSIVWLLVAIIIAIYGKEYYFRSVRYNGT